MYRLPGRNFTKAETQWSKGLWLGRDAETDENLIGSSTGVTKTRAVGRLSPEECFDRAVYDSVKSTPLDPCGTGAITDELLPTPRSCR